MKTEEQKLKDDIYYIEWDREIRSTPELSPSQLFLCFSVFFMIDTLEYMTIDKLHIIDVNNTHQLILAAIVFGIIDATLLLVYILNKF